FTCRLNTTKDSVYVLESENPTEDEMTALLAENSSREDITAVPTDWEIVAIINQCEPCDNGGGPSGTERTMGCNIFKHAVQSIENFFGGGGSSGSSGGGGTPFCTAEGGIGGKVSNISDLSYGNYVIRG